MAGTGARAAAHMQKHRVAPSARPRLHQRALLSYPPRPSTAFSFRSLLNRLLRRTCLSLPTFFLPCYLCFTLFPLPCSPTSSLVPAPGTGPTGPLTRVNGLHFHRVLQQMGLLFLLLLSRQIFTLPHGREGSFSEHPAVS